MKKSIFFLWFSLSVFAQKGKDYMFTISTSKGEMKGVLYDQTPKHKANFIKLVKSKFYDDLLFHRVINDFMIQGGDPTSKDAPPEMLLGSGGDNLPRIPYEFTPSRHHKKGVIAAARDGNIAMASSACQFYIVDGKQVPERDLKLMATRNKMTYTDEQIKDYATKGGTPHLDNFYTVFGEILTGFEVLEKIASAQTNPSNRPIEDIKFSISLTKYRKKKIVKKYGFKF